MKQISYLILLCLLAFSCKKEKQDCPLGYTGDDCKEEVKPKAVHISNVFLNSYSATNHGNAWDTFSQYADPYFTIEDVNGNVLYISNYIEEAFPGTTQIWSLDFLCDVNSAYFILFHDYDSANEDENIAVFLFQPYTNGQGFPVEISLADPFCSATLLISYDYN